MKKLNIKIIIFILYIILNISIYSDKILKSDKKISAYGGLALTYTDWEIGPLNSINSYLQKLTAINSVADLAVTSGTTSKVLTGVETRKANMTLLGGSAIFKIGEKWSISYSGTLGTSGFDTLGYQAGNIYGRFADFPPQYTASQNYIQPLRFNTSIYRMDQSITINKNIYEINCNNNIFIFGSFKYQEYDYHSKPRFNLGVDETTIIETGSYLSTIRNPRAEFRLKSKFAGPGLGLGYSYLINTVNSINLSLGLISMSVTLDELIDVLTYLNYNFREFKNTNYIDTRFQLQEKIIANGYTFDTNYNLVLSDILFRIHFIYQVTTYKALKTDHFVYAQGYSTYVDKINGFYIPISNLEDLLKLPNTGFTDSKDIFSGISFSVLKHLY